MVGKSVHLSKTGETAMSALFKLPRSGQILEGEDLEYDEVQRKLKPIARDAFWRGIGLMIHVPTVQPFSSDVEDTEKCIDTSLNLGYPHGSPLSRSRAGPTRGQ